MNRELRDSWLARGPRGGYPFVGALREHEYLRTNGFAQKYVHRLSQWEGRQVPAGVGERVPYGPPLRSWLMNAATALALKLVDVVRRLGPDRDFVHRLVGRLVRPFVRLDGGKSFRDVWYLALPTDDAARTRSLLKGHFTELWLPVEQTDRVLALLEALLEDQAAASNFAVELYGAKSSPFWLSPSHQGAAIRVDPYSWVGNAGRPEELFTHYWNRLLDVPGARFHWGKHLPEPGRRYGGTVFGLAYLRRVHPRLDDWLRLRSEFDPRGVFLNDYWRRLFELG